MAPLNPTPTIMFYVQHLLGIGHIVRAMRVARGLAEAGCTTHVVWGGNKFPGIDTSGLEMHYLEAAHVGDAHFEDLLLKDGRAMDEVAKKSRADHLLQLYATIKPDIVITEAFPFGRTLMRFELVPLMQAAAKSRPKPLVVCSIRDIVQQNRRPMRVRQSLDAVHQWYDLVMVHGDPQLVPIEATLEGAAEIADKIRHSGLVTPEPVDRSVSASITPDVIVSAGGGAVGRALMLNAVDAMAHCKKFPTNWCLATGPYLGQKEFDFITDRAPAGMIITRFIDDLSQVMAQAKVSVSRAGYNTLGDLLRAQSSAVLVPFTGGVETEQLYRARLMQRHGLAVFLLDEDLTPQALARAVDLAAVSNSGTAKFNLDGARGAAKLLLEEFYKRS